MRAATHARTTNASNVRRRALGRNNANVLGFVGRVIIIVRFSRPHTISRCAHKSIGVLWHGGGGGDLAAARRLLHNGPVRRRNRRRSGALWVSEYASCIRRRLLRNFEL